EKHIRPLCRMMKEMRVPAEINFLGLAEGRNYPNPMFWKIAGEEQVDTVLGVDAHHTEQVLLPDCERMALEIVKKNGLHLLEKLDLSSCRI
ncbi:MAG: hypothetical protein K5922_09100, partial [Clostridiales bacterium]|nr:hypothetical protein [Clostridiales bacterium]